MSPENEPRAPLVSSFTAYRCFLGNEGKRKWKRNRFQPRKLVFSEERLCQSGNGNFRVTGNEEPLKRRVSFPLVSRQRDATRQREAVSQIVLLHKLKRSRRDANVNT